MHEDDENISPKQKFNPFPFAAWLSLAVALYFLSVGPIVFLHQRGVISESTIKTLGNTVYAPLVWLHENSEFYHQLHNRYLDLWM